MSIFSTTAMAFSMSADAFAASVGKGASLEKPKMREALRTGAVFGIIETITPIIGWVAGLAASRFITSVDHWIAFIILGLIGWKMIYESLKGEERPRAEKHTLGLLMLTAIGTSIDAMAVGVTFAFLNTNIWVSAIAIGLATFCMATIGFMTGHFVGSKAGRIVEGMGGACLILIGSKILLEHLGYIG